MNVDDQIPPWAAFSLGSLAGLAVLLRTTRKLTLRVVAAAALNSGLSSLAAYFIFSEALAAHPGRLAAACLLCGVGGASFLDVLAAGIRARLAGPPK